MLGRGVVMEIGKHYVVVMTADGQFVKAELQGNPRIGEEINFKPFVTKLWLNRKVWYSGAAAAVLLIVLPLLLFVQSPHPVVAYLSVDVNPSLELGVDEDQKVRELTALNADAEQIIEGIDYEGKPVGTVVSDVMNRIVADHYINEEGKDIVITSVVLNEGDSTSTQFESSINGVVNQMVAAALAKLPEEEGSANVVMLQAPSELREAAADMGVSSGKMAVYLIAKEEGYDIALDQLKSSSIDSVTEDIGGVPAIMADSEQASKEGLKQLVEKERVTSAAKAAASAATEQPASPTPQTQTPKPADPAESPSASGNKKEASSSTPKSNSGTGNSPGVTKPQAPKSPAKPDISGDGNTRNNGSWQNKPDSNKNKSNNQENGQDENRGNDRWSDRGDWQGEDEDDDQDNRNGNSNSRESGKRSGNQNENSSMNSGSSSDERKSDGTRRDNDHSRTDGNKGAGDGWGNHKSSGKKDSGKESGSSQYYKLVKRYA